MSATRQEGAHGVPTFTILSSEELENMRSASGKRAKSCAAKTFLRKGQLNRNTRFGSQYLPFCSSHMALESGERPEELVEPGRMRRQLAHRSSAPHSDDDDDDDGGYEEWVALPNGSFQFASTGPSERQPSSLSSTGSAGLGALAAYAQTWAVYVCVPAVDAALLGAQGAVDSRPLGYGDMVLLPAAVLAGLRPTPRNLVAAHLCKLLLFAARLPFVWDHEWCAPSRALGRPGRAACCMRVLTTAPSPPHRWASLHEAALVAAWLLCPPHRFGSAFCAAARTQLILLYASAAFWKLNTSFLSPSTSCATVIVIQQLAAYAPLGLATSIAPLVGRSPACKIVLPACKCPPRRLPSSSLL